MVAAGATQLDYNFLRLSLGPEILMTMTAGRSGAPGAPEAGAARPPDAARRSPEQSRYARSTAVPTLAPTVLPFSLTFNLLNQHSRSNGRRPPARQGRPGPHSLRQHQAGPAHTQLGRGDLWQVRRAVQGPRPAARHDPPAQGNLPRRRSVRNQLRVRPSLLESICGAQADDPRFRATGTKSASSSRTLRFRATRRTPR